MSYLAISINHKLSIKTSQKNNDIKKFISKFNKLKLSEETSAKIEKDGIFTGQYCLHPITREKDTNMDINYVLDSYGTGVVMGVPAHDSRDYDFAKKFNLKIIRVINNPEEPSALPYLERGLLINSNEFDGMKSDNASEEIAKIVQTIILVKLLQHTD